MAVKIGSARSSYGNTSPGDQSNGKEVSTQSWYLHSLGWVLLRPKSAAHAELIAKAMEAACANDRIGYDQGTRGTLYSAIKDKGFDPSKCTSRVNTDCSALVRVCCAHAGIMAENFTTSGEVNALMATGAFEKLTADKYTKVSDYLNRGDILVTKTKGHTVVVLSDGVKAKPRGDAPVLTIADGTWNVRAGAGTNYATVGKTVHGGEKYVISGRTSSGWVRIPAGWISPKAVKA